MKKKEEESGVSYQDVQRAEAEEIMGTGIHGVGDEDMSLQKHNKKKGGGDDTSSEEQQKLTDAKRKFEEAGNNADSQHTNTSPSVAHHAMAGQGPVSEERWEGKPEEEVENWIQEELYIHAKLLIVDDRIAICGSSNLNDRSQEGHHDSELSIVMEDTDLIPSVMDGQQTKVGRHAATLRRYLWREHLGLLPPQELDAKDDVNAMPPGDQFPQNYHDQEETYKFVEDPLSDELWDMWTGNATKNTEIFRHLFHADPDDHVKTFKDYDTFLPPKGVKAGHIFDRFLPPDDVRSKLDQIKGHLVWMPLDFLKDDNMAETGLQVNQITESVYT
ncbi:Peroxisomal targeting signal receptor [Apiospora arundinis]